METLIEETTWAYFAGLIDGEGYLNIFLHTAPFYRKKSKLGYRRDYIVNISNTSKPLLESLQKELGHGTIFEHKRKIEKHRSCFTLRFYSNSLRFILPHIIPYLRIKQTQASLILESLTIIKEICNLQMREEKQRIIDIKFQQTEGKSKPNYGNPKSEGTVEFWEKTKYGPPENNLVKKDYEAKNFE